MKNLTKLLEKVPFLLIVIMTVIGLTMAACGQKRMPNEGEYVTNLRQLNGRWKGSTEVKDSVTQGNHTIMNFTLEFSVVENNKIEMKATIETTIKYTTSTGNTPDVTVNGIIKYLLGQDTATGTIRSETNVYTHTASFTHIYDLNDVRRASWLVNEYYIVSRSKYLLPSNEVCTCTNCYGGGGCGGLNSNYSSVGFCPESGCTGQGKIFLNNRQLILARY